MANVRKSYFRHNLLDCKVLVVLYFVSCKKVLWYMVFIGIPMIVFGFKEEIAYQVVFFFSATLLFAVFYGLAAVLPHYFSLRSCDDRDALMVYLLGIGGEL